VAGQLAADPVAGAKTVLTPTYVDVATFAAKQDHRFDEPMIYVGRLTAQKNLHALIRACGLARRPLVLVGVGEQETELKALAAEQPVTMAFAGLVPNEQLATRLREHSVFILPSHHEGLPKVLIEAMACGLVCIGTAIPGIVDLIRDGENGYLIDGFDAEAIAVGIERAYSDRKGALGRAARATVEDVFSLERYAAREAELYANVEKGSSLTRSG
jgi:glycosyltransferase involved in cell wall biosynthesis